MFTLWLSRPDCTLGGLHHTLNWHWQAEAPAELSTGFYLIPSVPSPVLGDLATVDSGHLHLPLLTNFLGLRNCQLDTLLDRNYLGGQASDRTKD